MKIFLITVCCIFVISLYGAMDIQERFIRITDNEDSVMFNNNDQVLEVPHMIYQESSVNNTKKNCNLWPLLWPDSAPAKMANIGKCMLCTGCTVKGLEFSLAACCFPKNPINDTCRILWFPNCHDCETTLGCCSGFWDWGFTLSVLTGPAVWIAGSVLQARKNSAAAQETDVNELT